MEGWRSIQEGGRTCPGCGGSLPCLTCRKTETIRPEPPFLGAARRLQRIVLGLAGVVILLLGTGLWLRSRHAERVRKLESMLAQARNVPPPEPPPPAPPPDDSELRALQAQLSALERERDELKRMQADAADAAAARQADLEQEMEILRSALEEKSKPPPSEPKEPERPKPPEPPKPEPVEPPMPPPPEPPKPEPPKRPRVALPTDIEAKLQAAIDRLRLGPADRKAATDALMELRRREPRVREAVAERLEEEKDPRVQARLQYVLDAVECVKVWEQAFGTGMGTSNEAVASDALLIVGVPGAGFRALKTAAGDAAWTQSTGSTAVHSPVLAGESLLSINLGPGTAQGTVTRTRLSDGRSEALPLRTPRGLFRLAADGAHFVCNSDTTKIECREARSVQRRWEASTTPSTASFAAAGGRVFFIDAQRRLWCRPVAGGRDLWVCSLDGLTVVGTAGDLVLVTDTRSALIACEQGTGKIRWNVERMARNGILSALAAESAVIVRSYAAWTGLDSATGKTLWTRPALAPTARLAPVAVSGLVASAEGSEVSLFEPRTGREILRPAFAQQVTALAARGTRLYVVLFDGAAAFDVR